MREGVIEKLTGKTKAALRYDHPSAAAALGDPGLGAAL